MKSKNRIKRINENQQLIEKVANTVIRLRYSKQPKLREIKERLFLRQRKYEEFKNQELRKKNIEKLDPFEKERWNRQIQHPLLNQKRIKDAKVVIFGCGGIGSNVLMGLIYSGVHNFKIIDFDIIELSNLNRQTLYVPKDMKYIKTVIAKKRLLEINPNASVESFNIILNYPPEKDLFNLKKGLYPKNITLIDNLIKWGDYIVSAADYNGAPYLINDLCVKNKKPYYWGGVNHFLGEIYSYNPHKNTPCLRCIFREKDFIKGIPFLRYREKKDRINGINLGSTVIATGTFISELIVHDICEIKNAAHGCYCIFDSYNLEIIKVPLDVDPQCECQKFN